MAIVIGMAASRASKETNVKQMGICLVGEWGPCNGDSNWEMCFVKWL